MRSKLQFLGAAHCVTGSKFLLEVRRRRLLVDCGLFQGPKELRLRNWDPLPIDAASVDAVVLTHAHVDHTGFLPRFVRDGFRGPVYATPATIDLLGLILPDSARLQEEQARYANEKGFSKHRPALPLYDERDAGRALRRLRPLHYGAILEPFEDLSLRLHPSGHILGAAFVELCIGERRIVISGDLGGYDGIVMEAPSPIPPETDYIVVESTYGGRAEEEQRPVQEQIAAEVGGVLARGGVVVIPAFAIGRTTLVLYHLRHLMDRGDIPSAPIFVDSPMATDAVELYCKHRGEHNLRIDLLEDPALCPIRPPDTFLVRERRDSVALNHRKGPAVIISASGMATGGRVLHHLRHRLPDSRNGVLLVGYQAQGTRGRRLLEGEERIKIHGRWVPVRAKIASIRGLSAHGDGDEVLRWLRTTSRVPRRTFLVHGEEESLEAMAKRVGSELGYPTAIPDYLESVELS